MKSKPIQPTSYYYCYVKLGLNSNWSKVHINLEYVSNFACLYKNDLTEVWQSAISKHLLFYHLLLSKTLYKLMITGEQAEKATYRGTSLDSAQKCLKKPEVHVNLQTMSTRSPCFYIIMLNVNQKPMST